VENPIPRFGRRVSAEKYINRFYEKGFEDPLPEQVKALTEFDRENSCNDMAILVGQKYM
jgi:hypothetical protein